MKTVSEGKLFEDRRPSCFSYAYLYPELLKGAARGFQEGNSGFESSYGVYAA